MPNMQLVLTSFHRVTHVPRACSDSCGGTGHKLLNYPAGTSQDQLRGERSAGEPISLQLVSMAHLVTSVPPGDSNNMCSGQQKTRDRLEPLAEIVSLLTAHLLLHLLGPLSFLPLANILNLLATLSF